MAKKNEILLSIALEGDQDVKNKLKAVNEEGKKSLSNIEKDLGKTGEGIGRNFGSSIAKGVAGPLSKASEALAPFLEGAGLGSIGGVVGGGGLLGRIFGAAGPTAALAALSGIAVHLAKVSEEGERMGNRLKALGGGDGALDKVRESAQKLRTDPATLNDSFEEYLRSRRQSAASDDARAGIVRAPGVQATDEELANRPTVIAGGRVVSGPGATKDQFLDAQNARHWCLR